MSRDHDSPSALEKPGGGLVLPAAPAVPTVTAEVAAARAMAKAHAAASEWLERKTRQLESDLQSGQNRERRLSQSVDDLGAQLAGLQAEIADRDRQIASALDASAAERTAAAAEIARLKARAVVFTAQAEVYERSQSWRFTAPLRAIRRVSARVVRQVRVLIRGRSAAADRPARQSSDRRSPQLPPALRDACARAPQAAHAVLPSADSAGFEDVEHVRPPAALDLKTEFVDPPRENPDVGSKDNVVHPGRYEDGSDDYVPLDRSVPVESPIKLIAFYLPQFHPIPENDIWWGRGFTEWTNVTRARPQFAGHYQPHLPDELGFYDLRLVDVQRRQVELAKLYGVHGFCFYHYWFGGRTLLRRPFDQFLARPELDFPFCLCWANENWTRRWDGGDEEVLIAQHHSPEDDLAFLLDIEPALRDPRCIRVGDRPVLVIYRPALLPDAGATAERWRAYCREVGLAEPFLIAAHAFDRRDPRAFGFDAAVEFPPNNMGLSPITAPMPGLSPDFRGSVYDYRELVTASRERPSPAYTLLRGVMPMWDNEPRRPSHGTILVESSPDRYREWLVEACRWTQQHVGEDRSFVFVNAWNEWAEGAHLEPDRRYGYAYLQATAQALDEVRMGIVRGAPAAMVGRSAQVV